MLKRFGLAAALALALAAPAQAADPIMPLSEVRPGMHCTGLTVVRGTEISGFDVEVLDVISGDSGESGPRILFRASGPAVDASGIAAGFSGSPLMCDDSGGTPRNAGAVSEGIGEYGNKVALATPIEEMLGERAVAARSARRDPRLLRKARPLAGPLAVSGLSPRPRQLLARAAKRAGRPLLAAPAGPQGGYPVQDLRPGAAVIASLASGDVSLGAIGTVTYRDGDTVLAFGHPLDGAGPRSLFMQDAYVYGVVSNPLTVPELGLGSYKLAGGSGHTVGTFTNDALSAVVGKVGQPPSSISLRVAARERGTSRASFVETSLADERAFGLGAGLSLVAPLAFSQTIDRVVRSAAPATFSTCVRFRVRELPRTFGYCNPYFDFFRAFVDLEKAAGLVEGYDLTPLGLSSLSVSTKLRRGVTAAEVVSARGPRRVHAGQRIRLRLGLAYPRAGRRTLNVTMRVPRSFSRGSHAVTIEGSGEGGGDEDEQLIDELGSLLLGEPAPEREKPPRTLAQLVRRVRAINRSEGIRARFSKRSVRLIHRSDRTLFTGRARLRLRVVRR